MTMIVAKVDRYSKCSW